MASDIIVITYIIYKYKCQNCIVSSQGMKSVRNAYRWPHSAHWERSCCHLTRTPCWGTDPRRLFILLMAPSVFLREFCGDSGAADLLRPGYVNTEAVGLWQESVVLQPLWHDKPVRWSLHYFFKFLCAIGLVLLLQAAQQALLGSESLLCSAWLVFNAAALLVNAALRRCSGSSPSAGTGSALRSSAVRSRGRRRFRRRSENGDFCGFLRLFVPFLLGRQVKKGQIALNGAKLFWTVQITLNGAKSLWTGWNSHKSCSNRFLSHRCSS